MKNLISTFYSNDEMRTALVYRVEDSFEVTIMDSYSGKEKVRTFESLYEAEDFAEDYVL